MTEERVNRKLAAILAADVVGYSRLMGADEAGTLAALKHHRQVIFDPAVAAHNGRIVKLIGDGTICEFGSVVDAVHCALSIQRANGSLPDEAMHEPKIVLRIGINLGDVIIEGDDIYGDGVNIAARLEPLAEPGGICVSSIVNESVGNRIDVQFRDSGDITVKNIDRPIRVWKWHPNSAPDFGKPADGSTDAAHTSPNLATASIAILPFTNMSGDPEQEYFSDGITEDIITDLSKIAGLTVIARNSSFIYKGRSVDIREVGKELGVRSVLEGSIRRAGNRVRITAQLVSAANDSQIWGERFDRDLNDIFALQDEISKAIVAALRLTLLPEEKKALEQRSTANSEAYKLYLMARQFWLLDNERNNEIVVRICKRVVDIDPNYAQAWATMSLAQWNMFWLIDAGDTGERAAATAMRLDPKLPDAHAAMGAAMRAKGDFQKGVDHCLEALRLDPHSYVANRIAGLCYLGLRRFQEAIRYFEIAAAAMDADFTAYSFLSQCYKSLGDPVRTRAAARATLDRIEKIIAAEPGHSRAIGIGACMLADLNEPERAKEWAIRARLVDPDSINLHYNLACAMAAMGDVETALDTLNEVAAVLSPGMLTWLASDADFDPIRHDPRFQALIEQVQDRLAKSHAS